MYESRESRLTKEKLAQRHKAKQVTLSCLSRLGFFSPSHLRGGLPLFQHPVTAHSSAEAIFGEAAVAAPNRKAISSTITC